jgi:hypothetical protein
MIIQPKLKVGAANEKLTPVIQQHNSTSGNNVIFRSPAPKKPAYEDCSESTTTITNPKGELVRSLDLAQRFVNGAICKLDVDPATEDKDSSYNIAQRRHFLSPVKAQRMGLKNNFKAILDKLKSENVRCAATDKDQAYCASSPEGGRMAAFMQGGQSVLCFNFWTLNSKCKAITLIHEAAHAIGIGMTTPHPPYRGSGEYPLGAGPAGKDETAAIRTNNPDAYGYFAAHVWRDIDTECRALSEIIEVKGSLPATSAPGKSKDAR